MLPFAALHLPCQTLPAHRCHEDRFTGAPHHRSCLRRVPSTFPPWGRLWLSHAPRCATRSQPHLCPLGSSGSRRGRSRQAEAPHGTQRPHSCHGSWGDKPLETPSVGGSGDIVSDPITLHPFRALSGFLCPSPAALSSRPSPRSDLITARSDGGAPAGGAGRDAVRSMAQGELPANLGTNFPLAYRASWQLGAALNTCAQGALPNARRLRR